MRTGRRGLRLPRRPEQGVCYQCGHMRMLDVNRLCLVCANGGEIRRDMFRGR